MFKFSSVPYYSSLCIKSCLNKKFKTKIIRHKLVMSLNKIITKQTNELEPLSSMEISKFLRASQLYLKLSERTRKIELLKKHPMYEIKMIFSCE